MQLRPTCTQSSDRASRLLSCAQDGCRVIAVQNVTFIEAPRWVQPVPRRVPTSGRERSLALASLVHIDKFVLPALQFQIVAWTAFAQQTCPQQKTLPLRRRFRQRRRRRLNDRRRSLLLRQRLFVVSIRTLRTVQHVYNEETRTEIEKG